MGLRARFVRATPMVFMGVAVVLAAVAAPRRAEEASAASGGAAAALVAAEYFIPAGAHLAGSAGTNWRTDVEVHNCGSTQATFTFYLLRRGEDNGAAQSRTYTLGPGQSVRYSDILMQVFGFSGAAAIRVVASSGCVMVNSRTYNQLADGTYGQFARGQALSEAVAYGLEGRIFHLTHNRSTAAGFRTNVGVVNGGFGSITVQIALYAADGTYLGTVQRTLRSFEYQQIDRIFEQVTAGDVADGYAIITVTTPGGLVFAYASVVDNVKGDAVFIPVELVTTTVPPTATATSTITPTSTVPPSPSYGPLTFSSDFNESTEQPINPGTSFAYGITKLYGSWPYSNVTPGTTFNFDWYRNGAFYAGNTGTLGMASGKAWQWLYKGSGAPLDSGTYELRISVAGQLVLSGQATIGAGPTPTTQASTVNLAKVTPSGWPHCVVCNWRQLNPPQVELLSIYYDTHLYWATANLGSTTLYGPVRFGIAIDNAHVLSINYANTSGWPAGSGLAFHYVLQDYLTQPGQHSVVVTADWDNAIAETNETDNACGFVGNWEAILTSPPDEPSAGTSWDGGTGLPLVDLAGSEAVVPGAPAVGTGSGVTPSR